MIFINQKKLGQYHRNNEEKICEIKTLLPPIAYLCELPITPSALKLIEHTRSEIISMLHGFDDRLLVIVGPCSINDVAAAEDYAKLLIPIKKKFANELLIVMRTYIEKPRTTVGWKGLIYDPFLNNSNDINSGLRLARQLLLKLNTLGMPTATEFLSMVTPPYFMDLISWGAIGARTTESQLHREFASTLSFPVGFKNNLEGNLRPAIQAVLTAKASHDFLSVTKAGTSAVLSSNGNSNCHIILRGGNESNYSAKDVQAASIELAKKGLAQKLMIDFSHGNSYKDYRRQMIVAKDVAEQLIRGDHRIFGVMIESYLLEGRQDLQTTKNLNYGQSITDACIGWDDTVILLEMLAESVKARRYHRAA